MFAALYPCYGSGTCDWRANRSRVKVAEWCRLCLGLQRLLMTSQRPTCHQLRLVEHMSVFCLGALHLPFCSICTSSACLLVKWNGRRDKNCRVIAHISKLVKQPPTICMKTKQPHRACKYLGMDHDCLACRAYQKDS